MKNPFIEALQGRNTIQSHAILKEAFVFQLSSDPHKPMVRGNRGEITVHNDVFELPHPLQRYQKLVMKFIHT